MLMKGKFGAYVLWPLAKKFQNWIVHRSTSRDFTVAKTSGNKYSIFFHRCSVVQQTSFQNLFNLQGEGKMLRKYYQHLLSTTSLFSTLFSVEKSPDCNHLQGSWIRNAVDVRLLINVYVLHFILLRVTSHFFCSFLIVLPTSKNSQ